MSRPKKPDEAEDRSTDATDGFKMPDVDKFTMEEMNVLLEIIELNPEGSDPFEVIEDDDLVPGFRFTLQ